MLEMAPIGRCGNKKFSRERCRETRPMVVAIVQQPLGGGGFVPTLHVKLAEDADPIATIKGGGCCVGGNCCDHTFTVSVPDGDEAAASGWDIARKDVRNVGRDGRVPYQKRAHQNTTMLS